MNLARRKTVVMAGLFVSVLVATAAFAQIISPYRFPPVVRMTGTLQPVGDQGGGLNALTISVHDKQWIFKVTRLDTTTGTDPGMLLLSYIFPPELRFFGPPERLAPLENPEVAGKPVTLEGFLYIGDRTFYVASVNVAADKAG
jgi:hypothetical protein